MGWAFWVVACLLAAMTAVVVALSVLFARERRRARAEREDLLAEHRALSARVEELSRSSLAQQQLSDDRADWVITRLGEADDSGSGLARRPVTDQLVLSAAFGEPLVKVVALGHGVRRALSPESRNRIRFEVRREVRRARKSRRKEMKQAWRQMRADRRSDGHPDGRPDGHPDGRTDVQDSSA
jgi:hypothetical protein